MKQHRRRVRHRESPLHLVSAVDSRITIKTTTECTRPRQSTSMGALALAEVEPALAGEILEAALKSLQLAMAEFAPDGAWKEGPGYWNYATSYNVLLLAALDTALGTDLGLSQINGFGQTGLFPIYLTGPLGRTFNYADGGDQAIRAPQMFWLARRFDQPMYAWFERQAAAHQDVIQTLREGRSPLVLTERNEHLDSLAKQLAPRGATSRGASRRDAQEGT